MIIIGLHPEFDAFVVPGFFRGFDEVFWEELTLLVEIISGTLSNVNHVKRGCSFMGHAPRR